MEPEIKKLPTGLTILFCPQENSLTTSILILVKTGTDLETKKINGISHFIEHLYFKGSKNYPNSKIVLESIDEIGGISNAFTSYEYTGFYIKTLPENTLKAIDILSDILVNPIFPEDEIEKERKVIIEEINLNYDDPTRFIYILGFELSFGNQPAGWSILGTKETISSIKRMDILNYVKENYSSKNTLIVVSGRIINKKKIVEYIAVKFKDYNKKEPKRKYLFRPKKEKIEEKIYHKPKLNQAHIFIGIPFQGFSVLKDKKYALELASIILGEKQSSRLFVKIREELGGGYYIYSSISSFTNRSLFSIRADIDIKRLEKLTEEIIKEFFEFYKNGPTEKELKLSKTFAKSHIVMELEDSLSLAIFYGTQYLLERTLKTPQYIIKKIEKVSLKDIRNVMNKFLSLKNIKSVFLLPPEIKFNFSSILKKFLK